MTSIIRKRSGKGGESTSQTEGKRGNLSDKDSLVAAPWFEKYLAEVDRALVHLAWVHQGELNH